MMFTSAEKFLSIATLSFASKPHRHVCVLHLLISITSFLPASWHPVCNPMSLVRRAQSIYQSSPGEIGGRPHDSFGRVWIRIAARSHRTWHLGLHHSAKRRTSCRRHTPLAAKEQKMHTTHAAYILESTAVKAA